VANNTLEPARAVASGDGPSPVTADLVSAPPRELAQRLSGTTEVLLLWHPDTDRVELSVRDRATDVAFSIDVTPADAIDAFYHPYAYAARRVTHG
jgi:hypothetical protein